MKSSVNRPDSQKTADKKLEKGCVPFFIYSPEYMQSETPYSVVIKCRARMRRTSTALCRRSTSFASSGSDLASTPSAMVSRLAWEPTKKQALLSTMGPGCVKTRIFLHNSCYSGIDLGAHGFLARGFFAEGFGLKKTSHNRFVCRLVSGKRRF